MPLLEQNMSLGQLRHEEKRLQLVFWEKAALYRQHCEWLTEKGKFKQIKNSNEYKQFIAAGDNLRIVSDELVIRNYEYAQQDRARRSET